MGSYWSGKDKTKQPSQANNANDIDNDLGQQAQYNFQEQLSSETRQRGSARGLRILNDKPEDKAKKIVAIIISFCNCSSYDNLFTTVQQKSLEGTKVQVYACDSLAFQQVVESFEGKATSQVAKRLAKSLGQVDSDCVVLNWECSSGYSGMKFTEGTDKLFKFVKKVIDRGHMAMFSDFSLKALVNQWSEKYELGPNPFVHTQEHTGNFVINFNPGVLKESPSAQLQMVGDMTEKGQCNVNAAGGTIVYCVDSTKLNHKIYKLEILTVVSSIIPKQKKLMSKIGEHKGTAGHVLLTYPSGGMILTSMGHWVQLMQIDTSAKRMFEVAEREYGAEKATMMRKEYEAMDQSRQMDYVSSNAVEFVKNQAPCSNMTRKARK